MSRTRVWGGHRPRLERSGAGSGSESSRESDVPSRFRYDSNALPAPADPARQALAEELAGLSDEDFVGRLVDTIGVAYPTLVPNDFYAGMLGVVAPDALMPNDKQNAVPEQVAELPVWRTELARRLGAAATPVEGESAMQSPAVQPLPPTEAQ